MMKRQPAKFSCVRCYWFQMSNKPPHNRGCMYPSKIELVGARCKMWKSYLGFWDKFLIFFRLKEFPVRSFTE